MTVPTVWIDAEHLGEHVHLKVFTGAQGGQDEVPDYDRARDQFNNAGLAGNLVLREDQWPGFIRALARGGAQTGLRVIWRYHPDDNRYLWNGLSCDPCIVGTKEPVPWEKEADR